MVVSTILHAVVLAIVLASRQPGQPSLDEARNEVSLVFEGGSPAPAMATRPSDGLDAAALPAAPPAVATAPAAAQVTLPSLSLPTPPQPEAVAPPQQFAAASIPRPPPPQPSRPRPAASAFPQPMMRSWSLGGTAPATSAAAAFRGPDSPGRVSAGFSDRFNLRGAEKLGSDWGEEFSAWVEQHKRYPEQALANDEDGTSQVTLVVGRDGHVREVSIAQRSGSQWLDMGTVALFRDRVLPPFPDNVRDAEMTIQFTMHYILLR